jgi:hypothetical protein
MELREVKRTTIYKRDAVHRPPSHMTLIRKVLHGFEHLNEADNQIPGDLACKTGTVGAARRLHGFNMASM